MLAHGRAAYLRGREPNFELTEAEKQELQLLQWEEFLEQTRQAILSKSKKSRISWKAQYVEIIGGCWLILTSCLSTNLR